MIKAVMRATTPDEISMTMDLTMTLKEWREIRAALSEDREYWSTKNTLARAIRELIEKAEKHFMVMESSE